MSQIRVELQLEDKSFVSGVWRAGQSLREFKAELARTNPHFAKLQGSAQGNITMFRRQEEATRSLGQRLRDLSVIAGGLTLAFGAITGASNGTVGSIVRVNAEMERLRYQLAGMSSAADPMADAAEQLSYLQELATKTPFSAQKLSDSFVKLKTAGLDPMNGSLRALTDGLAAFGGSDENLHRVSVALTQMQGKGVLSMEELRQQLGESMPNAMQMFARSMNVTVGELSKLVSTGMVESRSAIQKFIGELDRSYSGTGQFMMQTFSGQMTRIRTEFTRLVTGGPDRVGEMAKAFDMLKERMGDLATFLASQDATDFFDSLGRGLQNVMSLMEGLSGNIVRIKDFFMEWGSTIAYALGGVAVVKAISGLATLVLSLRVAYQAVAVAARKASAEMAASSARMAISNSAQLAAINAQAAAALAARQANRAAGLSALASPIAVGGAMAANTAAVARTAGAFGGLVAAGSRFLGVLGPIALGVSLLGPIAWEVGKGIYSWASGAEQAKEAIDATIESSVQSIRAQREAGREFLLQQREAANNRATQYVNDYGRDNPAMLNEIGVWQAKLDKYDSETAETVKKFLGDNITAQVDEARGRITEATRLISRDYHMSMIKMDNEYTEQLDSAEKRGEAARTVQERFRERRNQARIARQKQVIAAYNEEIKKLQEVNKLAGFTTDPAAISALIEERERLRDEMDQWSPDDFKVDLMSGIESDDKKFDRLVKNVESGREKFKELEAEIMGASGSLAKLVYQIKRGDFGKMETATEETIKLRDTLIETTVAVETLDTVMKGLNETGSAVDRISENQRKEILRLKAIIAGVDPQNEFEFLKWQRDNGFLDGMGDPQKIVEEAINQVTKGVDLSMKAFGDLGTALRDDAFGANSVLKINQTGEALTRVRDIAAELRGLVTGGLGGDFVAMPGFNAALQGAGFGNLAGAAGTDYLRYSNQGATRDKPITQDLANAMSFLKEMGVVMEVFSGGQDGIGEGGKRTGSTRHDHGNAADARFYQNGRMLDWANPADQQVFQQIVQQARKRGVTGFGAGAGYMSPGSMHLGYGAQGVWGAGGSSANAAPWLREAYNSTALGPRVSEAPVVVRLDPQTQDNLVTAVTNGQAKINERIDGELTDQNAEERALKPQAEFMAAMRELEAKRSAQTTAGVDDERVGANERNAREEIAKGTYKGVSADELQKMVDKAIEVDKHLLKLQERQKDLGKAEGNREKLEEDRREVEQRRLDALARAKDPNYQEQSSELRKLVELEKEQLAIVERLYGKNSPEYKAEAERLGAQRSGIQAAEAAEAYVELSDAARAADKATITNERTLRQREFEERVAELAALRDRAIQDGALVAEANKLYEQAVANERKKLNLENRSELKTQLDSMAKYAEKINASTADWAGSLSGAIYDSFSDKDAFKNLGNTILESIARSLTDAAAAALLKPFEKLIGGNGEPGSGIGGIFDKAISAITNSLSGVSKGMMGGMTGILGKGGAGATKGAPGAKAAPVGVKHTGGIIGVSGGRHRMANLAAFAGAPKFHTGGIVGGSSRGGLNPSEVPIIAQKGEGIFTSDQMKHLGGSVNNRSISISAPISVNANGGTPEQNADLARQMAEQTEKMFRGIVHKELLTQMRPGGMLR